MLSKRFESNEFDRRTWLHLPSGTHWSTSSDTHQVREASTKMYTPFLSDLSNNMDQMCISGIKLSSVILSWPNKVILEVDK